MRKRTITDEQLVLLDKLVKEGKRNDEIYRVIGVKYYAIDVWKKRIRDIGLDVLLNSYDEHLAKRRNVVKELGLLEVGASYFVDDDLGLSVPSLLVSLFREGKKFSKQRQVDGVLLVRVV